MNMSETAKKDEPQAPAPIVKIPRGPQSQQMEAWEIRQRQAKAFAESTLVPQAYQRNIPNVLIAMEMAERCGASVMMVMQNLDIIHGTPGWRAKFLIATVNASGRFTPLRFRWQGTESADDWGCRCYAKDVANGEECIGALISMRMAKEEGWSTRQGTKWKTMPEQMLMYRAAAFWTRVYAPELSLGMQTAEELGDMTGATIIEAPRAIMPGDSRALEAELLDEKAPAS
jgi:hypothetical protein